MSQYKSQIQNFFLSDVRKRHQPVEVVLDTGTTLRGRIKSYDQFSITLVFKEKTEVIYKSAILYVSWLPKKRPMRVFRPGPRSADVHSFPRMRIDDDPPPPKKITRN